jgi:histidine triad (HIT) family protein
MTDCDICSILSNKDLFNFIYEDEVCFAILHESPAYPGHVLVIPKEHIPIIEEIDDKIVEHLFNVCNKVSTAIFETMGAHGTNIILNNGLDAGQELAHLVINVIPRKEKDGLNFEWAPKKISADELKITQNRMKIFSESIYSGKDKLPSTHAKDLHHESPAAKSAHEPKHDAHVQHTSKPDSHGSEHGSHNSHDSHGHGHDIKKPKEDYLTKNLIRMP